MFDNMSWLVFQVFTASVDTLSVVEPDPPTDNRFAKGGELTVSVLNASPSTWPCPCWRMGVASTEAFKCSLRKGDGLDTPHSLLFVGALGSFKTLVCL